MTSVEQIMLLVQQYASQLADAAMHQAPSRADIAKTQALKTLGQIRTALMALHPDRVASQSAELERVRLRLLAAELLTETSMVDRMEASLIRQREKRKAN